MNAAIIAKMKEHLEYLRGYGLENEYIISRLINEIRHFCTNEGYNEPENLAEIIHKVVTATSDTHQETEPEKSPEISSPTCKPEPISDEDTMVLHWDDDMFFPTALTKYDEKADDKKTQIYNVMEEGKEYSVDEIAKLTGMKKDTVRRCLDKMVGDTLIRHEGYKTINATRGHTTSVYKYEKGVDAETFQRIMRCKLLKGKHLTGNLTFVETQKTVKTLQRIETVIS